VPRMIQSSPILRQQFLTTSFTSSRAPSAGSRHTAGQAPGTQGPALAYHLPARRSHSPT